MAYEALPLESDPDAATARILAGIAAALPGWSPREGALEVALAEEIGRETAATNARTRDAAASALAGIGQSVHGLAALGGAPAILEVDLAVVPGAGVVPAGLTAVGTSPAGAPVAYALPGPIPYAAGATPRASLQATAVGAFANGTPVDLTLTTATSSVISVAARGPAAGGADPESRDQYLARLVDFISLLRPGGVRAGDLALLARNTAGIARALAVDLYDADAGAPAAKAVALYPIDTAGAAVPAPVAAALRAAIEAVREVGLLVSIGAPTYTALDVLVTVGVEDGAEPDIVAAAVTASVAAYLSPATWGAPRGDPRAWVASPVVRFTEIIRAAGIAEGVAYVTAAEVNGDTADVVLPGVAALPAPASGLDPTVITVVIA